MGFEILWVINIVIKNVMNDDKEKEETKNSWNLPFGISTTPCAKFSIMNSIGASFVAGVAYNLATSRTPIWVVPIVCLTTHTGSWFYCRYNYWKTHIENQKLGYAMSSYHYLRGTEGDRQMDQEFSDKI